jgi:hypothetical protein
MMSPRWLDRTARGIRLGSTWLPGRRRSEPEPWVVGFAVRRDWPDGTHEFVRFRRTAERLGRFIERDRAFWQRGPLRPRRWATVAISRHEFDLHADHRQGCQAPDCTDLRLVTRSAVMRP